MGELDWLLNNLASTCLGQSAVILSPDGLPLGRSPGLSDDDADHRPRWRRRRIAWRMALADSATGVGQTIVEMDVALCSPRGVVFPCPRRADAGQLAYELAVLVKRVGQHMIADPRFPVQDTVSR